MAVALRTTIRTYCIQSDLIFPSYTNFSLLHDAAERPKTASENALYCGDNLEILKRLPDESVDLIYIDPPFFSNKNYEVVFGDEAEVRSFEDRWEGGMNVYIEWMRERLRELHRVLNRTGSFYLHCDWHASHYLKVMLDEIFSPGNFRNEIVWHYGQRNMPNLGQFSRKHDTIFFYTKSDDHYFKVPRVPYTKDEVESWWNVHKEEDGRLYYLENAGKGKPRYKRYVDEIVKEGKAVDDVWEIRNIQSSSKERMGYPTQKPITLLKRILEASSKEHDIVLDAFCGCGTSLAAAQEMKRHWIGIDISPTAVKLVERRLQGLGAIKDVTYTTFNTPTTETDLKALKPFEFQNWVIDEIGAKHAKKKSGDMGLDGYFEKDLWHDNAGVQVKQSDSVGRNVVDNFETALTRGGYQKGYIVAFSFTSGAHEEAARIRKEGLEIKLIDVADLLGKKKIML